MEPGIIYQMLQPLTYLLFATGFFMIWLNFRSLPAAGYWSVAYLLGGISFMLEGLKGTTPYIPLSYISNLTYWLTACYTTAGFFARGGQPIPTRKMAVLGAVLAVFVVLSLHVVPSIELRAVSANFINGAVFALPLPMLFARRRILIDKILFWLLAVIVAQFFIRTGITVLMSDEVMTPQNYQSTFFAVAFHFCVALAAVAMAITFYVALGIDIVYALERSALIDKMTGLLNRDGFEKRASKVVAAASITNRPLCLILTDLDRFKAINDTFGHVRGDAVIRFFGRLLGHMCRKSDVAGRVGGEEFCLLLDNCGVSDAFEFADATRLVFSTSAVPKVDPPLYSSASFGVALLRKGENFHQLYERADKALYEAKRAGRNRVNIAEGDEARFPVPAPSIASTMRDLNSGDQTVKTG